MFEQRPPEQTPQPSPFATRANPQPLPTSTDQVSRFKAEAMKDIEDATKPKPQPLDPKAADARTQLGMNYGADVGHEGQPPGKRIRSIVGPFHEWMGASGMAPVTNTKLDILENGEVEPPLFLVCYDNKKRNDKERREMTTEKAPLPRLALHYQTLIRTSEDPKTYESEYENRTLNWPSSDPNPPNDCEALSATEKEGQYQILASEGRIIRFELGSDLQIKILDTREIPNKPPAGEKYPKYNFEGLQHMQFDGQQFICLLHRGGSSDAKNAAARLFIYADGETANTLGKDPLCAPDGIPIVVPAAGGEVKLTGDSKVDSEIKRNQRSGADLFIDGQHRIFTVAAYDALEVQDGIMRRPDLDPKMTEEVGQLASALYYVGVIKRKDNHFFIDGPGTPQLIQKFNNTKIEGISIRQLAGKKGGLHVNFVSDDEDQGSRAGSVDIPDWQPATAKRQG